MHVTHAALLTDNFKLTDWLLAIFTLALVYVAYKRENDDFGTETAA
jgi:hypothetical protein